MGWIDFDGDYGRAYDENIRTVIAGYQVMHELGVGAALACCPRAHDLLVVGPAWGEEMQLWGKAYPSAQFTLVEPSKAMVGRCQQRLQDLDLTNRCEIIQARLEECGFEEPSFDVVVAQLVLHLLIPDHQRGLAVRLARLLRPGGLLLFSGASLHGDRELDSFLLDTWRQRLMLLEIEESVIHAFAAVRGREVFAMNLEALAHGLSAQACSAPQQIFQAAGVSLWFSRKTA